ncbi:MAG: hypothetical protein ACKOW9_00085 [Candidatus Paceibacterota bacterium]
MRDIEELMGEARIDGEGDVWEIAAEASYVSITADDLGDEWVISFTNDDELTQYVYLSLDVESSEIVSWLKAQGLSGKDIKLNFE